MDERKIIERLAVIRRLAAPAPPAVLVIDALMQEMVFGCWPNDADETVKPTPEPPRKMEFFL